MPRIAAGYLLAGLCWTAVAFARDGQEQPFFERIEVEILNLEVVVTNRDGQRIPNLKASDFELYVQGEKTAIDFFTEVREGKVPSTGSSRPEDQPGPTVPSGYLLFIDEFFPLKRDKDRVLGSLKKQIGNMGPGDQMAVVAWNGAAIEILSDWQSSPEALAEVLDLASERESHGLERELDRQRLGLGAGDMGGRRAFRSSRLGTQERDFASMLVSQLQAAVGAASASMRSLSRPAGRNALILLSGGWPNDVASYVARFRTIGLEEPGIPNGAEIYSPLTRTANLLGYTIYAVDVPGLQAGSGVNASGALPMPIASQSTEFQMETDVHTSLRLLADETGGLALFDGHRLDSFADIRADLQSYYSLGFTPMLEGEDVRRELEVRLADENLQLRTRAAYYDLSTNAQVELAVESSLLFGPARRSAMIDVVVSELEKKHRGQVEAKLTFLIQSSALTRAATPDGWTAQAILFIGALDEKGGRSEVTPIQVMISGKEAPGSNETYRYEKTVKLSWKTQRLSVALYDIGGSRTFVTVLDR